MCVCVCYNKYKYIHQLLDCNVKRSQSIDTWQFYSKGNIHHNISDVQR